jgi:hypothetical protein
MPMAFRILGGAAVAGALALVASDASIGGVAAWKVIAAVVGLAIFVRGGRSRR